MKTVRSIWNGVTIVIGAGQSMGAPKLEDFVRENAAGSQTLPWFAGDVGI